MKALKMFEFFLLIAIFAGIFVWLGTYMAGTPTNYQVKKMFRCKDARDYQLELYMDTVWVWDGDRLVGRYTSNWNNQIDTILITDNQ